jgi:DNA-binding GntR family transcriptional regulator
VVEKCSLPRALFNIDDTMAGIDTTLVFLAEKNGIFPGNLRESITIEMATGELAEQFDVESGAVPLLRLERVVSDIYCRPIEWRVAYCDLRGQHYFAENTSGANIRAQKLPLAS